MPSKLLRRSSLARNDASTPTRPDPYSCPLLIAASGRRNTPVVKRLDRQSSIEDLKSDCTLTGKQRSCCLRCMGRKGSRRNCSGSVISAGLRYLM